MLLNEATGAGLADPAGLESSLSGFGLPVASMSSSLWALANTASAKNAPLTEREERGTSPGDGSYAGTPGLDSRSVSGVRGRTWPSHPARHTPPAHPKGGRMNAVTKPVSRYRLERVTADFNEWGHTEPTVGYCGFCPEIRFEGTADQVVALGVAHRELKHPGSLERLNRARRAAKP